LINKGAIKIADFGYSYLKGSDSNTGRYGVIPYMDPKCFETHSYRVTEKSDIYSLGVLFWELTSRKSPFDFEAKIKNDACSEIIKIELDILEGKREKPFPGTNRKFVALYESKYGIIL
jgi:serine/threonine protein kinase